MNAETDREETLSAIRAILKSLKRTELFLGEIRGWLRFFGVLTILGILAAIILAISGASMLSGY